MASFLKQNVLLNCCNFIFLICGFGVLISGFYLFSDTKCILLSRLLVATSEQLSDLPQPLFYYVSIGLIVAGVIAILTSIIGFWASCLNAYCFLNAYFFFVIILLLAESVICLAIILWPNCLGINLDETRMVKALQGNYGIPGKEQFTLAMDLAQARFGCCGINSDINYDTSLWKLQGYGQLDWAVPLTCCTLENLHDKSAYLDPKPTNESQCQTLQKNEYEKQRHMNPCLDFLNNWYRERYTIFLVASLAIAIVEFCVLLNVASGCTRITEGSGEDFLKNRSMTNSKHKLVDYIYEPEMELGTLVTATSARRQNTSFKPKENHYHISTRSYLV